MNSFQDNERKPFLTKMTRVTLTCDLVNPTSTRGLVLIKTNQHVKYKSSVIGRFEVYGQKQFGLRKARSTYQPILAKQYTPFQNAPTP